MTIAVIDLGTNTFNLLVAKTGTGSFITLHNEKAPVKLGEGGIHKNLITPDAFERGVKAMIHYRRIIDHYHPDEIRAFGTSALRSARNGPELVNRIAAETGIRVEVISGEEEASLIFRGISASVGFDEPFLVMDIGGGSVEFIIAVGKEKRWEQSFSLGIARLLETFRPADPITETDIRKILAHLDRSLEPLWSVTARFRPEKLVGASGTFDTIREIAAASGLIRDEQEKPFREIPSEVFTRIYGLLIRSTFEERRNIPGLVWYRADMIVVATIFVNFVLSRLKIGDLIQTGHALKEGVVIRRMEETNTNHDK